jgi:hypothetical protein
VLARPSPTVGDLMAAKLDGVARGPGDELAPMPRILPTWLYATIVDAPAGIHAHVRALEKVEMVTTMSARHGRHFLRTLGAVYIVDTVARTTRRMVGSEVVWLGSG